MPAGDNPKLQASLDDIAKRLKLTVMQQKFSNAYAVDPERNGTAAARAAGAKFPAVQAVKWLKLAKVQAYLSELSRLGQEVVLAKDEGAVVIRRKTDRREIIAEHESVLSEIPSGSREAVISAIELLLGTFKQRRHDGSCPAAGRQEGRKGA